jgi:hypothetical protein
MGALFGKRKQEVVGVRQSEPVPANAHHLLLQPRTKKAISQKDKAVYDLKVQRDRLRKFQEKVFQSIDVCDSIILSVRAE